MGGKLPDLVLVDGRFRVACALKSLYALAGSDSGCKVIVDDYTDRPEYHVVSNFAEPYMVGRMAVFERLRKDADIERLSKAIAEWETIPE